MNQQTLSSLIWSVADLLRGDFKQSEYGTVILPFTVLRRLDCVLDPTKDAVLKELAKRWKPDMAQGVKKHGKHEALADIYESINEMKYYRDNFIRL